MHVTVERLPDGRDPHRSMWLWHVGPGPLSLDEVWRAYLARFDIERAFKFAKGALGLTAAKVRTPEQADRWAKIVTAACAQPLLACPLAADLRRPLGEAPRSRTAAHARPGPPAGFATSAASSAPPPATPSGILVAAD
jgi:hypothetical protein